MFTTQPVAALSTKSALQPDDRVTVPDFRYRILSVNGRVIDDAATLSEALTKYNRFDQAALIALGSYIVLKRKAVR